MITDEQYTHITVGVEDMELDAIWDYFEKPHPHGRIPHGYVSFTDRREGFLWVVKRLVEEKQIKLVKKGVPLPGNIKEQIEIFRQVFPKSDEEMEDGIWFFSDACPAGCDWKWRFSKTYGTQVSE